MGHKRKNQQTQQKVELAPQDLHVSSIFNSLQNYIEVVKDGLEHIMNDPLRENNRCIFKKIHRFSRDENVDIEKLSSYAGKGRIALRK